MQKISVKRTVIYSESVFYDSVIKIFNYKLKFVIK